MEAGRVNTNRRKVDTRIMRCKNRVPAQFKMTHTKSVLISILNIFSKKCVKIKIVVNKYMQQLPKETPKKP
jgi:hypothetical protein